MASRSEGPTVWYISHPEIVVDPAVPVPRWRLSPDGRRRAAALGTRPWVQRVGRIVSSDEVKAVETAELLGGHRGVPVEVRAGIGEMDRSSTGFLPPDEFDVLVDRFFAEPARSAGGWERAVDAQERITAGLDDLIGPRTGGDVAVVGHGGVGTLWYCRLSGNRIDRRFDQPGMGHYFGVDVAARRPLHGWRSIDG